MHVVMISDAETKGGAAVAASRLASGLVEAGHSVTRLLHALDNREHEWQTQKLEAAASRLPFRIGRKLLPSPRWNEWNRRDLGRRLRHVLDGLKPDVINLHNLHGGAGVGWSVEMLAASLEFSPTVWTMHDMWSFTGRCAYNYGCLKFRDGCDAGCPTPDEYPALPPAQIAGAWQRRWSVLQEGPGEPVAVTPSRWMAAQAAEGMWRGRRIEVIPYGLPLDTYRPHDRAEARRALGIKAAGPVLLAVAEDLSDRRKGLPYLLEALPHISARPLTLLTMGSGDLPLDVAGVTVHPLGYVYEEDRKVLAYNAADIFAHPAPVDNLPNVVMEALACGTPAVGFAIGGMPDMVRPGETGWLAEEVSAFSLAATLDRALEGVAAPGRTLREECRQVAEAEYSVPLQAERYTALFKAIQAK